MAKIFRILLPVNDIERAASFYNVILSQPGQRISPGRHYFNCEGVILACFDPIADGDDNEATPLTEPIYIAVDELEAIYRRARRAGAQFSGQAIPQVGVLGQIVRRPWGELSFYASDPFGNPLCFVQRETMFTGESEPS